MNRWSEMGFWKRFRESIKRRRERERKKHPHELSVFSKLLFHDRSDQPSSMQIIDLLYDIRGILLFIAFVLIFK